MTEAIVSAAQRETYQRDGVVLLRGLFTDWVAPLREGVEQAMADPSLLSNNHAPDGRGRFFTDIYMWRRLPAFRRFIAESVVAQVAAELMGSSEVRLYNEHLLVKEAGADAPTPWHQDEPYFLIQGDQCCSLWLALDHATSENGAMKFVRGSHTWGKAYWPVTFKGGEDIRQEGFAGPVPDIDSDAGAYDIITYELSPGDCTVHHGMTLHGAPPNRSAAMRRRGLSYRFIGDDIRFKKRRFSAPLPEVVEIEDGAPLNHPLFPKLWPSVDWAA
jgi:ectoine hydroxylase-related dioxygenase (phytanoyl-CoA dioxygenase family)